jgi:tetratricopeptide (TPR) repeat protein
VTTMDRIDNLLWQIKFEIKHNWLKAKNILRKEIEENPGNTKLQTTLADLYQSKRLFRKAITEYQKVLPNTQHRNAILYRIGNCFLALNEFKLAFSYYDQIPDDFPELFYNKAFSLSKLNRQDEAIEVLKKMFSMNFQITSEMPYIFLAELHYTRREFDKAIYYLDIAEKNFGKKGSIFYLRGLTYFNLKNWLKAFIEFQNADKLKVSTAHFYKNFGLSCEKIGKTTKAIDLFLRSIKLAPLDAGSYIELIKIYLGHERVMEAYSIAQHAKKNIPYSITLSMLYDQILQRLNKDLKI